LRDQPNVPFNVGRRPQDAARWDKRAIDAKRDEISGLAVKDNAAETDLQKWKRERDARKARGG